MLRESRPRVGSHRARTSSVPTARRRVVTHEVDRTVGAAKLEVAVVRPCQPSMTSSTDRSPLGPSAHLRCARHVTRNVPGHRVAEGVCRLRLGSTLPATSSRRPRSSLRRCGRRPRAHARRHPALPFRLRSRAADGYAALAARRWPLRAIAYAVLAQVVYDKVFASGGWRSMVGGFAVASILVRVRRWRGAPPAAASGR
jgi:hypothetical protein